MTALEIGLLTALISFVTAIIGLVSTLAVKRKRNLKIIKQNQSQKQEQSQIQNVNININQSSDEDNLDNNNSNNTEDLNNKLADCYTSIFAEEDKLKSEKIKIIKNENGQIEGEVYLQEISLTKRGQRSSNLTYKIYGKFSNKVLTADYISVGNIDERGVISLKLIDSKVLSGFCSFSKITAAKDEIRVSPYVWVEGENSDLLNGTFEFCTECFNQGKPCCCSNNKIDMPLFTDSEYDLIRQNLSKKTQSRNDFSSVISDPYDHSCMRQMLRVDETVGGNNITRCHFYDFNNKKCNIYDGRPIDCRIFPFDIRLSDDKSEYNIIYYNALCDRELPDYNRMKIHAHILRPYFFLLYPYLHLFTAESACERLKNAEFRKIDSFKDFVF